MPDWSDRMAAARLRATNHYPYLASAVFATTVVPAPGQGRLTIDRWWRVHADPDVVADASVEELAGELLHLTSHVLRDHAARADAVGLGDEAELHHWVDSADAEIADDFDDHRARVSPGAEPEDLGRRPGRLAEEYYRAGEVRHGETVDCGSGAHGEPAPGERPPPRPGDDNVENAEAGGVPEHEQVLVRRSVAAEIERMAADQVPEGLRRWAAEELAPTVDWRAELTACLRRAVSVRSGAIDYSYARPSRRSAVTGSVILPSLRRPAVEVAVVCDTSASVSDELLGQAVAEVDGLLRATGTRSVRVLSCDDAVRTVSRATAGRDITLVGGGGTDMSIGLAAAMEERPQPDLIIVLTDGYTPWPVEAPAAEVVVGLLADDGDVPGLAPAEPPSWARTVPIGP
jgi:predicted metal-dependent peptidase